MDEPPGARISTAATSLYGRAIIALRSMTNRTVNTEPSWRHARPELTTGYSPRAF
jgi:hydrogenase small subunit